MNSSINQISKNIVRTILILGSALLLVGILLVSFESPGEPVSAQGTGNCDIGWVFKANAPNQQGVFVYNGPDTILKVFIKSGQNCIPFSFPPSRQTDGCYQVNGLGTSLVTVFKIGPDSPQCQDISHVEFYAGVIPTPTDTATNTPTPTDTPTPTNTATNTPTATNTSTPVVTDPIVTLTPTDTPVTPTSTDPPPTVPPPDQTATFTPTEPDSSPTTPPTVPPPTIPPGTATPQVLIPVTGNDSSISGSGTVNSFWLFIYFGIGLIGVGMIFYGVAKYYKGQKSE